MENKTTLQEIVVLNDKKKWENPTLVIVDQGSVNGGPVGTSVEGASTVGLGATYHS